LELHPIISVQMRKWLPAGLIRRLDPFGAAIDDLVRQAARLLPAGAKILDAGAGESRYAACFSPGFYIGLDSTVGERRWDYSRLNLIGDLHRVPLKDDIFDAVLCIVTLEHVHSPLEVLRELHRTARPGASLWMVTPFLWEEHQKPHDYYRYTSDGLTYLLSQSRWEVKEIRPAGGYFQVMARRSVNLLSFFQGGWRWLFFPVLAPIFGLLLPLLLCFLDPLDRQRHFTLGHIIRAVAR